MKKITTYLLLTLSITSKIKILQPPSLIQKFPSPDLHYTISTFGEILFTDKKTIQLQVPPISNKFGCKSFAQPKNKILNNFVWIVQRGTCTYSKKAHNAQESGAYALLVYHDSEGANIDWIIAIEDSLFEDIVIPVILISYQDGMKFMEFFYGKKIDLKHGDGNLGEARQGNVDDQNFGGREGSIDYFQGNKEVILFMDIDNVI